MTSAKPCQSGSSRKQAYKAFQVLSNERSILTKTNHQQVSSHQQNTTFTSLSSRGKVRIDLRAQNAFQTSYDHAVAAKGAQFLGCKLKTELDTTDFTSIKLLGFGDIGPRTTTKTVDNVSFTSFTTTGKNGNDTWTTDASVTFSKETVIVGGKCLSRYLASGDFVN